MAVGTEWGRGAIAPPPPIFCQPKMIKSLKITTYKSVYNNEAKIVDITDILMCKIVSFCYESVIQNRAKNVAPPPNPQSVLTALGYRCKHRW